MYYLTGFLGLVSGAAPFILGYNTNPIAMWTSLTIGAVLLVASIFEAVAEKEEAWEYWVAAVAGVAAVAAPFVLGFSGLMSAVWTLVIVGVLAIIFAGTKLYSGGARYGY